MIPYNVDDTLNDVIKRINRSEAGVVAFMNHDNQLVLKGVVAENNIRENFMIRHLEDSGKSFLSWYDRYFKWKWSSWIF